MPPSGDARNTGNWLAKPTVPSSSDDPVIRYTSQDWATLCIQVPIKEMSCPLKNSWKFRWRRARQASCQREAPEAISLPFAALSGVGVLDSGTMACLDDATRSLDQYNLSVPNQVRRSEL